MAEAKETKLDQIDLSKLTIDDILKLESPALRSVVAELVRRPPGIVALSHQSHGSHSDHATHTTDGSAIREAEIERIVQRVSEIAKRTP